MREKKFEVGVLHTHATLLLISNNKETSLFVDCVLGE